MQGNLPVISKNDFDRIRNDATPHCVFLKYRQPLVIFLKKVVDLFFVCVFIVNQLICASIPGA